VRPFRPDEPSYAGVGVTFCRTALVLDPAELHGFDVAIVGAPFDDGTSFRPGARFGPRAIRTAEDVGGPSARPHMVLGLDPFAELRVVDHGDVEATPGDLATSHRRLCDTLTGVLAAGAVPVVLGGDHSLTAPTLQALANRFGPDGYAVLHLDTHADTGADTFGVANTHGTPFRRGVTEGFLRGRHVVQIGLRGTWPTPPEFAWMREHGFRWHTMDEVEDRGLPAVVAEAVAAVREQAPRVYLTVDIDVLDPAFAPGTGTPEPGGLTTRELLRAVRTIAAAVDLCAMDVVEVSPPYDPAGVTALAAQRVVLEALSGLALRRSGRSARPERP
jgi:agmatinase